MVQILNKFPVIQHVLFGSILSFDAAKKQVFHPAPDMGALKSSVGMMASRVQPSPTMKSTFEACRMPPMDTRMIPIDDRMPPLDDKMAPIDDRMPPLDDKMAPIDDRMPPLHDKMAPIDDRMPPLHDKMAPIDDRMPPLDDKMPPPAIPLANNKDNNINKSPPSGLT